MNIQILSPEVQSALRSGLTITDTLQCVIELVQNSLDAGSTSIAVRVDLEKLTIQVVDNGCGLSEKDLNSVGTRYMTNKCHSLKDFKTNLNFYGFRGESLASLRESCGVLMIVSKPKDSENTFCKVFRAKKDAHPATTAVHNRLCPGTTVIVKDFLVNLPVRQSRVQPAIEIEDIRHALIYLSIINYKVSFTLRNDVTKVVVLQTREYIDEGDALKHHCKTSKDHTLISTTVTKPPFKLISKISRQTETNYHFQMIFVNKRLVKNKILYKTVNKELENSFYLNISRNKDKAVQNEKCFPVYVISIICPHFEYDISSDPKKLQVEFRNWDIVTECLKETVAQFLSTESQLNGVDQSLFECNDKKLKECEAHEQKECSNLNYEAKTNVVYTTLVQRNIIQKHPQRSKTNSSRTQLKERRKLDQDVEQCKSSFINENGKQANSHAASWVCTESVQHRVTGENIITDVNKELYSNQILASALSSGEPLLINNKTRLQDASLCEYPLHSDSNQSFTFVRPNKRPLKRKFTEHILTESESDVSPAKQKISGQLRSVDYHANKIVCNTKMSILPIISEEFLNENLDTLTLSKNAIFDFPKKELEITPNQAIQIDYYRSVKRHPKSNDIEVTHKHNVKFIDFDKGHILNCSKKSQSSIQLNKHFCNNFPTTMNQHNILDSLQDFNRNISTALGKQIKPNNTVQTKHKNNLSLKVNRKRGTISKQKIPKNICKKPLTKRYKTLQVKRALHRSKSGTPQKNVNFLQPPNLYELNETFYHKQSFKENTTFANPLIHLKNKNQENIGTHQLCIKTDSWGVVNSPPLYGNYKTSPFVKPSFKMFTREPEENAYPHNFSLDIDRYVDPSEKHFNKLLNKSDNLNYTSLNLYEDEYNSKSSLIIPICNKFRELSIRVKSVKSKHFPHYAANTIQKNEMAMVSEHKSNCFQSTYILNSSTSQQCYSVENSNFDHVNPQMFTIAQIYPETIDWSHNSPYQFNPASKFESLRNDSSPKRQTCIDGSVFPTYFNQSKLFEHNPSVTEISSATYARGSVSVIPCGTQVEPYNNGSKSKQSILSVNEDITTCDQTLNCMTNENQENVVKENIIHWNEENTLNGQVMFVNPISGMSYFKNPSTLNQVTGSFKLNKRHWFMPKGISPLLTLTVSNVENIADLSSVEKDIMETIIQPIYSEDLATVKWKNNHYKDSILQNMTQSENIDMFAKWKPQKPCVFSAESIKLAKVLGQLDGKFIGTCLKPNKEDSDFLVLFDQHAVDERIRVETLISGYKNCDGHLISQSINPLLEVSLSESETNILESIMSKMSKFGLRIDIGERKIYVSEVPLCLWNRAVKEKHDANDLLTKMVTVLIKQILLCAEDLRGLMPSLLPFVQDIINMEACRGAIKFGDILSLEKCKMLISKLALCETPFQCAHGRPVLTPLLEIVQPTVQENTVDLSRLRKKTIKH